MRNLPVVATIPVELVASTTSAAFRAFELFETGPIVLLSRCARFSCLRKDKRRMRHHDSVVAADQTKRVSESPYAFMRTEPLSPPQRPSRTLTSETVGTYPSTRRPP